MARVGIADGAGHFGHIQLILAQQLPRPLHALSVQIAERRGAKDLPEAPLELAVVESDLTGQGQQAGWLLYIGQ